MEGRFVDRVIIVTGGGSGLGEDYCYAFAREGGHLVCADIDQSAADRTVATIKEKGGSAITLHCDVTSARDVEAMASETMRHFGRIDVLINNAGVIRRRSLTGTTEEDWDREIMTTRVSGFLTG